MRLVQNVGFINFADIAIVIRLLDCDGGEINALRVGHQSFEDRFSDLSFTAILSVCCCCCLQSDQCGNFVLLPSCAIG